MQLATQAIPFASLFASLPAAVERYQAQRVADSKTFGQATGANAARNKEAMLRAEEIHAFIVAQGRATRGEIVAHFKLSKTLVYDAVRKLVEARRIAIVDTIGPINRRKQILVAI